MKKHKESRVNRRTYVTVHRLWKSRGLLITVAVGLALFGSVASPFMITFDGHFYMAGSVKLFESDAANFFWWLREPGYSVFIRQIRWIGQDNELWLSLVQTSLIVLGGWLTTNAVWKSIFPSRLPPPGLVAIALIIGSGNAGVLFYGASALQQALFVFFLGAALRLAVSLAQQLQSLVLLSYVMLIVISALVQEEFARLLTIPMALAIGVRFFETRLAPHLKHLSIAVAAGLAALLLANFLVTISLVPWDEYRQNQAALATGAVSELASDFGSLSTQIGNAVSFKEPHLYSVFSHFGAFIGARGSTQFESKHYERRIYIINKQSQERRCGSIEEALQGFESVHQVSVSAMRIACRNDALVTLGRWYSEASFYLYPLIFLFGFVSGSLLMMRRTEMVAAPAMFAMASAYVLLGFGADRYSVPLLPVAAALFVTLTFIGCVGVSNGKSSSVS